MGVIEQLHFTRVNLENMSPWLSFSLTFSIANTHTISYENISPSPNVLGLVRQQDSPQWEADQRRSLHSTCLTDRPP